MKILVMSIKPQYSRKIFRGEKQYELRRTPVKVQEGDVVIVYESSPRKAIVGAFVVNGVRRGQVDGMWSQWGNQFGVTEEEYKDYFSGADTAHAIKVGKCVEVSPVPLSELRQRFDGFRPPQSYMYWRDALEQLLGDQAADAIGVA